MFVVDDTRRRVVRFLSFKRVQSPFGFLQLMKVEKHGYEILKRIFTLQANSLLHRWSQIEEVLTVINNQEVSTNDTLKHKVVFIGGFLA